MGACDNVAVKTPLGFTSQALALVDRERWRAVRLRLNRLNRSELLAFLRKHDSPNATPFTGKESKWTMLAWASTIADDLTVADADEFLRATAHRAKPSD